MDHSSSHHDSHDIHIRNSFNKNLVVFGICLAIPFVGVGLYMFVIYVWYYWKQFLLITNLAITGFFALLGLAACAGVFALFGYVYKGISTHRQDMRDRESRRRITEQLPHVPANAFARLTTSKYEITPIVEQQYRYNVRMQEPPQPPALPPPLLELPRFIRYEDVYPRIPSGHSLVGVGAGSEPVTKVREDIRGLTAVFGASNTGKSNSVVLRVHEDVERDHALLVVDPHVFKRDSLARAVSRYKSHFLYPVASETEHCNALLQQFIAEFERRKRGGRWNTPWTLIIDEVSSLTSFIEDEDEKRLAGYIKHIAQITGHESRGFDMCAVMISQDATYLNWLRRRASMTIAHQVLAFNERLLVANNDRNIARSMDTWPKGRTLVYGIGIEEGPQVYQQPVVNVPRVPDVPPMRNSVPDDWGTGEEQPVAFEEQDEGGAFPYPGEQMGNAVPDAKISSEERERIIQAAHDGVKRREMCKYLGKGKGYYDIVKQVLDEEGL